MASKQVALLTKTVTALAAAIEKLGITLAAKQVAFAAKSAELEAAKLVTDVADAVEAGLPAGTNVTFYYGRAETKKTLAGVVLASKPMEKGATLYRIQTGDGFDQQSFTIQAAAIISHDYNPTPAGDPLDGIDAGDVTDIS
jgi:hypothetical protein